MSVVKKTLHGMAIAVSRVLMRLIRQRIPKTFTGPDASRELCEAIGQTQAKNLLVVSDSQLVEIGLVAGITEALDSAGLQWSLFDGVEPDPTFAQVDAGLEQLERDGCDAVLAIGGGSPIDASKAIAAMATNGRNARKLEGLMKVKRPPLPLFAIPTTAGTGSEATIAAVVSDTETHAKKFIIDPKLIPQMAALDPCLMLGLPPHITAATGMDALTHAVEAYISLAATRESNGYATSAVVQIFRTLPTAHADGANLEAREAMSVASYHGGLAFTRTGVGYVHAIAHTFGAFYGTPHGLANAIVLPHVLEFSLARAMGRLAELADCIELEGASDEQKATKFIEAVRELMVQVDIPSTLDALKADDIPSIAAQALAEAHASYAVPRYMVQSECETLLARLCSA